MFSRWMFVRLKAAERALDEGRLDDAFERLAPPDVLEQRRAQKLLDGLGKALLAQARLDAQAGRYHEALMGLERLSTIDRVSEEAIVLRKRAEEELKHRVGRHAEENRAFREAADDLKAGRLESGRMAVERLEDAGRREQLREELDIRVQRSAQLLEQSQAALERGDLLTACRFWDEAVTRHGRTQETDALAAQLVPLYRERMDAWLAEGRLDRLRAALEYTAALRKFAPVLDVYERLHELVRRSAAQFNAADYDGLRESLLRLRGASQEADWMASALASLDKIGAAQAELLSSPLGLLGSSVYAAKPVREESDEDATQSLAPEATRGGDVTSGAPLGGDPLLMLVDGTGSCLLVADDVVKIGRAGGMSGIEIPIPADMQSNHADIQRDGGDYFLVAHGPVKVNRRSVSRVLLQHGDRVVLGSNGKFVFHKPSAKSETAVLKMADRCRLPQDVSHVVLFCDTCLLGPQPSCHVRTREGDTRLVLFERRGQLFVRRAGRDGRPTGPADPLPTGETRDIGDLRVTVKRYQQSGAGGTV